jgi:excisionase family DNA binding protein
MLNNFFSNDEKVILQQSDLVRIVDYCLQKSFSSKEQFPPHLNIKQLSRYLNYSEAAIYRMVGNGEIPSYKISGKLLFKKSEIDDWLFDYKQPTIKSRIAELESFRK